MDDRELLELAAKAAGIAGFWVDAGLNTGSNAVPVIWNPFTDDGDALRLAVKLQLQITPGTYNKDEFSALNLARNAEVHEHWSVLQDEFAATRRATVRAAAHIGKSMK